MLKRYFILLIWLLVLLFSCSKKQAKHDQIVLQNDLTFTKLASNYRIIPFKNQENQGIIFKNTGQSSISGEIFYLSTNKSLKIKSLRVLFKNIHSGKQKFKLYLNGIYTGKYTTGEYIKLYKKIHDLRIVFLKSGNEKSVHAWKNDLIIKLYKQTTDYQLNIILEVPGEPVVFHHYKKRVSKTGEAKNKKFINRYFNNNRLLSAGIYYRKKKPEKIQYSIRFFGDNTFVLYLMSSLKNKSDKEIFYFGDWKCTKIDSTGVLLNLTGNYHFFHRNNSKFINGKQLELKARLKHNVLFFNKLLPFVYIDFPDDAMVNLKEFLPAVKVEMPYATKQNFTKTKLYPCNKCFVRYKVAKALQKIQQYLQKQALGLKFFDCYRPYHIQMLMFEKFPFKGYVANPAGGSIHNRGLAVDLSIVDNEGKELDMGTGFDDLSLKSNHTYLNFPDTVLQNRLFLKKIMEKYGFSSIRSEWWHYNFKPKHLYPVIDDPILCE